MTPAEAVLLQERLRHEVRLVALDRTPDLVAGADVAYSPAERRLHAGAAVVSLPSLELVEVKTFEDEEAFPYVPGLFAFRELPALLGALSALTCDPGVVMFDGHGLAHPRRFGLAAHAGIVLRAPTVGCAKCVLMGRFEEPGHERGARSPLTIDDEVVGAAVRTRPGAMPVFVSPGHLTDVESAVAVALAATGRFRIPEPLRQAHIAAVRARDRSTRRSGGST